MYYMKNVYYSKKNNATCPFHLPDLFTSLQSFSMELPTVLGLPLHFLRAALPLAASSTQNYPKCTHGGEGETPQYAADFLCM